jgi:4-amino-4-deoxy-L-arabinose transferase-like glycosyltransferase
MAESLGPAGRQRGWTRAGVLFLAALAVRLLALALLHGRAERGGLELGDLSDHIVRGDGFAWDFYGTTIHRLSHYPPLYPYLMALAKISFGAHWALALQLAQCAIGALVPLLTWRLARRVLRADLAWIAGYLAALWPPFVAYAAEIFSATIDTALLAGVLLLLARALEENGPRRVWLAAGALAGVLALTRPELFGVVALLPLAFRLRGMPWRRALTGTAIVLGAGLLVLAPWTARNYAVQHRIVPVSTGTGFNLLGANNPYSVTFANVLCTREEIRWKLIDRTRLETMNEADFDRELTRRALGYMLDHPGQTLRRMGSRTLAYWWAKPKMISHDRVRGWAAMIGMSLVLPLFLLGLAAAWPLRRATPVALLYAACLWANLAYMNFSIQGRYSLPLQPVVLILATLGAARITAGRGSRPGSPPPPR